MTLVAVAALMGLGVWAGTASAAKVRNGGFERGNLSGWTKTAYPAPMCGRWEALSGPIALPRGLGGSLPSPPQGEFAAVASQPGCPSGQILSQVVKLKPDRKHRLHFKLAYVNFNMGQDNFVTPPSLGLGVTNQQFRMDVMKPGARTRSVKGKHVLKRVYRTDAGDPNQRNYRTVRANLSKLAGRKVRLRFAVVVNEAPILTGIDAVKIKTKN